MPLRPARPVRPRAMQQRLVIVRQFGVNHQSEVGQIDTASGDVGRDTDARASVTQRLQGVVALALAQFARQRNGGETAFQQARLKMAHCFAGVAEHHRGAHLVEAQDVDDRVLDLVGRNPDRPILDIAMRLVRHQRVDAKRVALVTCAPWRRCYAE